MAKLSKRAEEAQQAKRAEEHRRLGLGITMDAEDFHLWENGEEEHKIMLIKKYLRTPEQKAALEAMDLTIEAMLNGCVSGYPEQHLTSAIFAEWNRRLGTKHFGGANV